MHLLFVKEGITRAQLLKIFLQTETGEFLSSQLVEYVRVKAFRLEPDMTPGSTSASGAMMVDGEQVAYGPVQAEIFPSLGNCLINIK